MSLSTKEYAELVGVSQRTVQRWIQEGKLNAVREGRSFRIEENTTDAPIPSDPIEQNEPPANTAGAIYYTTREYAELLGVSQRTVQRRIENGEIYAERDGRRYVIPVGPVQPTERMLPETFEDEPIDELYPIVDDTTLDPATLRKQFADISQAETYRSEIPLPSQMVSIIKNKLGLFRVLVEYEVVLVDEDEEVDPEEEE